jgi:hypothetical protein
MCIKICVSPLFAVSPLCCLVGPRLLFGLWSGSCWAFLLPTVACVGPACLSLGVVSVSFPLSPLFVSYPFPCSNHGAARPTQREKQGTGARRCCRRWGGVASVAGGRRRRRCRREASPALQEGGVAGVA